MASSAGQRKRVKVNNSNPAKATEDTRLGVTVLSGFLGAGKTTLLKHLLHLNSKTVKYRFALIVNDMNELNIDANIIKRTKTSVNQADAKLVELQNGCICCTLREDLLEEIKRIAEMPNRPFDYMIIESTGIGEPMPVAETFTFGELDKTDNDESNKKEVIHAKNSALRNQHQHQHPHVPKQMRVLSDIARLDTLVTVVDVSTFRSHYTDIRHIGEGLPPQNIDDADDRTVSNLLVDQIEFANIILLNKVDLVDKETLEFVRAAIRTINIDARLIETKRSSVKLKDVINTHSFSFKKAAEAPMWLKEARGEHVPETEEYGISSFVYEARRPFHPQRLYRLVKSKKLKDLGLLRSKGEVWIASFHNACIDWSGTTHVVYFSFLRPWYCMLEEHEWQTDEAGAKKIRKTIEGEYGDRKQMLVFIGFETAKERRKDIEKLMNQCLLTDKEFEKGVKHWDKMESDLEVHLPGATEEDFEESDDEDSDEE